MNYRQVVEWLARDILSSTEHPDKVDANVGHYMADLIQAVHAKATEIWKHSPSLPTEKGSTLDTGGRIALTVGSIILTGRARGI